MTSITVRADRRLIRSSARSQRFVLVELTAPPATQIRRRPPVNLAFVLDRSGSMSGEKIALAKRAVEEAIGRFDARDRFSIVVYDDGGKPVIRGLRITVDDRYRARLSRRLLFDQNLAPRLVGALPRSSRTYPLLTVGILCTIPTWAAR